MGQYDRVHIDDEKWFLDGYRYILLTEDKTEPTQHVKQLKFVAYMVFHWPKMKPNSLQVLGWQDLYVAHWQVSYGSVRGHKQASGTPDFGLMKPLNMSSTRICRLMN
jgi:hypothetical protein